ncbi:MAG: NapC/NirT family cytochrome c [Gammaproteobacteria bacterium]
MTRKRKIFVTTTLGVTTLILIFIAGKIGVLSVYGVNSVFHSPGTCGVCHETWYNEATYAFNPKGNASPGSSGVTIGCAECHPVQYEEYQLSAMGGSDNVLRPGCTNCHDKMHSVSKWYTHMYRGTEFWTQMVQLALRDRELYNTELGLHLAPKARARFIETDSARCRECHRKDNLSLFKGTLGEYRPEIPPHQEAKEQNVTCIQCHQNLTHNLSYPVAWSSKSNGALQGNFESGKQKSATCAGCHGADGNSALSLFPSIAGLNVNYLTLQLRGFKTGRRKNATMQSIVAALSKQDMLDLAVYFSKQKMRPTRLLPKVLSLQLRSNLEIGAMLYQKSCARCHGLTGRGQGIFPALAGQYPDYAVAQMLVFKEAKRDKHSIMRDVAKGLSDKDLRLIADYLAGLK